MTPSDAEKVLFIEFPEIIELEDKEKQILQLLRKYKKKKESESKRRLEIAQKVGLTIHVVNNKLTPSRDDSICKKLGLETNIEAVVWQREEDLLYHRFQEFADIRSDIFQKKETGKFEDVLRLTKELSRLVEPWLEDDFSPYHWRCLLSIWFESQVEWLKAKNDLSKWGRSEALDQVTKNLLRINPKYPESGGVLKKKYTKPVELRAFLSDQFLNPLY